jgi:heme/copper-type cytochrome/quinol oxidase subunit 2
LLGLKFAKGDIVGAIWYVFTAIIVTTIAMPGFKVCSIVDKFRFTFPIHPTDRKWAAHALNGKPGKPGTGAF